MTKPKIHIYYSEKGLGVRVALAYFKIKQRSELIYYGYFIGYSGGRWGEETYNDLYFKTSRKKSKKSFYKLRFCEERDKKWSYYNSKEGDLKETNEYTTEIEWRWLYRALDTVALFLDTDNLDEDICSCEINKKFLKKFYQESEGEFYYETKGVESVLLFLLSRDWCLATQYDRP